MKYILASACICATIGCTFINRSYPTYGGQLPAVWDSQMGPPPGPILVPKLQAPIPLPTVKPTGVIPVVPSLNNT